MPGPNPYAILGIKANASGQEIKRAYRNMAKEFHPDRAGDSVASQARFRQIREAYELLSNLQRRALWDAQNNPRNAIAHGPYDSNRKGPYRSTELDDLPPKPVIPRGWKAWQKTVLLLLIALVAMIGLVMLSERVTP